MKTQELAVQVFGQLTDITGSRKLSIPPMPDTNTLRVHLIQQFPGLASLQFAIAVNHQMAVENTELGEGSSIALLPPFSGG